MTPLPRSPATYRLVDEKTGSFYIGSTGDLRGRIANHRSSIERGCHPNRQIRDKLTSWDNVRIEYVLCDSVESAHKLEDSMIEFHHGEEEMLNVAITNNCIPTPDSRVYISSDMASISEMARSPESRQQRSEKLKGLPKSDTTRLKMSESAKIRGNNFSTEGIAKGRAIRSTPVVINGIEYSSERAAGRALGVCSHTVKKRVNSSEFDNWSKGQKEEI